MRFLSTLPARGATHESVHQYNAWDISIHAPREGSDGQLYGVCPVLQDFYPRSPRGERLLGAHAYASTELISIHAPREGSDEASTARESHRRYISIHAPREGSDGHPLRHGRIPRPISIHAPREGSDSFQFYYFIAVFFISIHAPREGSDPDGNP